MSPQREYSLFTTIFLSAAELSQIYSRSSSDQYMPILLGSAADVPFCTYVTTAQGGGIQCQREELQHKDEDHREELTCQNMEKRQMEGESQWRKEELEHTITDLQVTVHSLYHFQV